MNYEDLTYPLLAGPAIQGTPCSIVGGRVASGQGRVNPNVLAMLNGLPNMTGVLVGEGVTDQDGVPEFIFWVDDAITGGKMQFSERYALASTYVNASGNFVKLVPFVMVRSAEALTTHARKLLAEGFKVQVRDPQAA
jgi:hypothetical protein